MRSSPRLHFAIVGGSRQPILPVILGLTPLLLLTATKAAEAQARMSQDEIDGREPEVVEQARIAAMDSLERQMQELIAADPDKAKKPCVKPLAAFKAVLVRHGAESRRGHDLAERLDAIADATGMSPPHSDTLDGQNPYALEFRYRLVERRGPDRAGVRAVPDALLERTVTRVTWVAVSWVPGRRLGWAAHGEWLI